MSRCRCHGVGVTVTAGLVEAGGVAVVGAAVVGAAVVGAAELEDPDSAKPCAYRNSDPEPAGSTMSCSAVTSNWMSYSCAKEENRPNPAEPTVRTCSADGSPM